MVSRELVVEEERVSYEGLFNVNELYKVIDFWLKDKGYGNLEKGHTESIKPEGRMVEISLEPAKNLTDYARSQIRIGIEMTEVTNVVVTVDEKKRKVNKGKVDIKLRGLLFTDYEDRWEGKPGFLLLHGLWNKYVYKTFTGGFQGKIRKDVDSLKQRIKSFLNLYKVKIQE
jgi:hypothetical protein